MEGSSIVIDDIRRYAFPLVIGKLLEDPDAALPLDSTEFVGTGFFITKNGVALTANHVAPSTEDLDSRDLLAVIWDGKTPRAHKVIASLNPDGTDVAILKIGGIRVPFLQLDFDRVHMGEDVVAVGIPDDSTWREERDFRFFKGNVTRTRRFLELSFPALRGISGCPVFREGKVVAVMSGNHRSEALEDQVTDIEELESGETRFTRIETKAVVNYGLAEPLYPLSGFKHETFGKDTFSQFVERMNSASDA